MSGHVGGPNTYFHTVAFYITRAGERAAITVYTFMQKGVISSITSANISNSLTHFQPIIDLWTNECCDCGHQVVLAVAIFCDWENSCALITSRRNVNIDLLEVRATPVILHNATY